MNPNSKGSGELRINSSNQIAIVIELRKDVNPEVMLNNLYKYTQLQKKILNSRAIKEPFCYYRLKTDNVLEISFTTRENYFKPAFNSEVVVEYYTTNGTAGNFDLYLGDNVEVYRTSEKYENNCKN